MANVHDSGGYEQGKSDGFNKGKQDGYIKGLEDAKALLDNPPLNDISLKWRELHCAEQFTTHFGSSVVLNDRKMECLKETFKSAIWKLEVSAANKQAYPIILKIFKPPIIDEKLTELNMYRKVSSILPDLMPTIYLILEGMNGDDVWVFMEYVPQVKGQVIFTPDHFDRIIPSLAKLHALTYNDNFYNKWNVYEDWLPRYESDALSAERMKHQEKTLEYLDKAMDHPEFKERLSSSYNDLKRILKKGPIYFPELIQAGKSVTHNDLQTPNMGCHNVAEQNWNIKFIDWEGARFTPCWFDMFNLIGVFFAYRKDWRADEELVIERCASLYAAEMLKYGIAFDVNPIHLYKMAYLQRVLERSLYNQLQWGIDGVKPAYLLDVYLEKIKVWGKELGLY
ncbi:aminoglycoside phosphotransferase family protein [Paenibacillus sp. N3/727]|uniref:phosphotransferase n=1 Tax=Paenibacillus sp. N3/727 TaxID=2925845 RepID=UPI001F52D8BD|nr:phosphotransferase [Paenibacillus sp. N3/727]UNK19747.1 aminoglycoside phosphotransferase family protein [Paenibacillus sp. N3/727]